MNRFRLRLIFLALLSFPSTFFFSQYLFLQVNNWFIAPSIPYWVHLISAALLTPILLFIVSSGYWDILAVTETLFTVIFLGFLLYRRTLDPRDFTFADGLNLDGTIFAMILFVVVPLSVRRFRHLRRIAISK